MSNNTTIPQHLLSPGNLHDLKVQNRVAMAPMTRARSGPTRVPNALMAEYYGQRAAAGLIITEATTISPDANGWGGTPGIYETAMVEGWKPVVAAAKQRGALIFLQLWHCGRASHSSFLGGKPPVAPSPIAIVGETHTPTGKQPYEVPRALTVAEIQQTVADFGRAAQLARLAGFDGVEIHGANGYLIDTFLQSKTNQRTDDYGGSKENRTRFLEEIVTAVTAAWPPHRVGLRLAPNGVYNDMGSPDYREQFLYVAQRMNTRKLAYLHVMDGLGFGFHQLGEPITLREMRGVFDGPLVGNCGYTIEDAEAAIARGDADLIAIGRPFISNPDLVERLQHGWPLAPSAEMSIWYSSEPHGYTDFPKYQAS